MQQPPGFVNYNHPYFICKLQKLIYGLKQAPRAWFSKLSAKLILLGFSSSKSDSSLFIYSQSSDSVFVLIYIDDILVTGSNSSLILEFIHALPTSFPVKGLGNLHYFLVLEVYRNSHGMFITQTQYISNLLKFTNMHASKPVSPPCMSPLNSPLLKAQILKILNSIAILCIVFNILPSLGLIFPSQSTVSASLCTAPGSLIGKLLSVSFATFCSLLFMAYISLHLYLPLVPSRPFSLLIRSVALMIENPRGVFVFILDLT